MPVGRFRNKKSGSQNRRSAPRAGSRPRSIAELLQRARPSSGHSDAAQLIDWIKFTRLHLPATLAPRVTGAELAGQVLSVRAESAGWAARLRFALGEAESEMRRVKPEVERIEVRVTPVSPRRGGGA